MRSPPNYTREAGVRQLERIIAKAFRKAATKLAAGAPAPIDGRPAGAHVT